MIEPDHFVDGRANAMADVEILRRKPAPGALAPDAPGWPSFPPGEES